MGDMVIKHRPIAKIVADANDTTNGKQKIPAKTGGAKPISLGNNRKIPSPPPVANDLSDEEVNKALAEADRNFHAAQAALEPAKTRFNDANRSYNNAVDDLEKNERNGWKDEERK